MERPTVCARGVTEFIIFNTHAVAVSFIVRFGIFVCVIIIGQISPFVLIPSSFTFVESSRERAAAPGGGWKHPLSIVALGNYVQTTSDRCWIIFSFFSALLSSSSLNAAYLQIFNIPLIQKTNSNRVRQWLVTPEGCEQTKVSHHAGLLRAVNAWNTSTSF